ncbi:hypothetical protein EFK50_07870 [Nocardioides marmoriginsengisoli]|uniref:Uncharacterized protein n=1 Tax=Nocardioides marmoriginsengisoli TaxID=661483 RepID=A0A3N0CK45_9ACTN|nr:hypothetical protein [Nocardioides marmoriginsengisoli]RNL63651.1 hypothetical protein EFK50_07870 [Nocardioides marmoriginsengisoli]
MIRTVVTREPEWDDTERAKMAGLVLYESQICSCGLHESIARTDPDMEIILPVCPVCADFKKQMRVLDAEDEKKVHALGEKPPAGAPRPSDGRSVILSYKGPAASPTP